MEDFWWRLEALLGRHAPAVYYACMNPRPRGGDDSLFRSGSCYPVAISGSVPPSVAVGPAAIH
jgi:hypothetical protein